ncbi:MFS transporter [Subtercola endophyticus]|uniref:MFS transporter n=1 Tax=Subtercola endophyticus TaxID=2895559 RepID=UPI001E3B153E|nr:MFS transporter [Subtercola endophyticus]UFS58666.1 MFS transporter [Subtercola endophyticus]
MTSHFTPSGALGRRFWLLVVVSTLIAVSSGAATPLLPLFIHSQLGGDATATGLVISIGSIVGLASQPLVGTLADRWGYKTTLIVAIIVGTLGILLMLVAFSLPMATISRSLFGIVGAAVNTICAAWVVSTTAKNDRGRALSLYGIGVWIGLAVGPQLGQAAYDTASFAGIWLACAALLGLSVLALAPVRSPEIEPRAAKRMTGRERMSEWTAALKVVALPGVVSALSWSAEGLILTFLIIHLQSRGIAASGLFGAASVFTVFGVSVIGARLLIGSITDRLGALRTSGYSLVLLAVALVLLAVADTFAVAAAAAVILGFAFAPLYPALTMLASEDLAPARRGTGLGIFGTFTSLGTAVGSLYGGILTSEISSSAAFLAAAALQLVGLVIVIVASRRASRTIHFAKKPPNTQS